MNIGFSLKRAEERVMQINYSYDPRQIKKNTF